MKLPNYLEYKKNILYFKNHNLLSIIKKHGDCLELYCDDIIDEQIFKLKSIFNKYIKENKYNGKYYYAYTNKSNYNKNVLKRAIICADMIETSSDCDLAIVEYLFSKNKIKEGYTVLCNGFKDDNYLNRIIKLKRLGLNIIPIIDNIDELINLTKFDKEINIGIRLNVDDFKNKTNNTNECSRFGVYYNEFMSNIDLLKNSKLKLTLFHFHMNGKIKNIDNYIHMIELIYKEYYVKIKEKFNTLINFDIGGCFPVLAHEDFNYELLVSKLIKTIKRISINNNIEVPNIIGEHGTYSVSDHSFIIFKVQLQKEISKGKYWYILNNSIVNLLPDSWICNKEFLVLPVNLKNNKKVDVRLAGLTCDSMDVYYYQENKEYLRLPRINDGEELYIAFFKAGSYQDILSGVNTTHHCLIKEPVKLKIGCDVKRVRDSQSNKDILRLLKYKYK